MNRERDLFIPFLALAGLAIVAVGALASWQLFVREEAPAADAPHARPAPTPEPALPAPPAETQHVAAPAPATKLPLDPDAIEKMLHAARYGDADRVREFLSADRRFADVISADRRYSPLINAAYGGHLEIVKDLLDAGAEIDRALHPGGCDKGKAAALYWAVFGRHPNVVELLVTRGAKAGPNDPEDLRSPLNCVISHMPSWNKEEGEINVSMVRLLVKAGANVRRPIDSSTGNTPLHEAVWNEDMPIIRVLLELGADPLADNRKGRTPSDYAKNSKSKEVRELFARMKW